MPTFQVTYFNAEDEKIDEESIFMKSLAFAKRSALIHAPDQACSIEIKDLMEVTLTSYRLEDGWKDNQDPL